jgi:hypothetical protein
MIDMAKIEAIKYAHQISGTLVHRCPDQEFARLLIARQAEELTPREQWENNMSLIQAPGWLECSPRPILCIGGRQNKKGMSLVSSFCLDFMEAIEMERAASIISVLCNSGPDSRPPTPLRIFSEAVFQTLQAHPGILTVPENIAKLSIQRFDDIQDSPEAAYKNPR